MHTCIRISGYSVVCIDAKRKSDTSCASGRSQSAAGAQLRARPAGIYARIPGRGLKMHLDRRRDHREARREQGRLASGRRRGARRKRRARARPEPTMIGPGAPRAQAVGPVRVRDTPPALKERRYTALVATTRRSSSLEAQDVCDEARFRPRRGAAAARGRTDRVARPRGRSRPRVRAAWAGPGTSYCARAPRDGRRRASPRGTLQAFRRCDARLHAVVDPVASTPTWGKIRVSWTRSLAIDTTRGT